MKRSIFAIAILLVGCATPEEMAYRQQQQAYQRQQEEAAYTAALQARCTQFGFTGQAHSECMMKLHQQNAANRAAAAAAILQGAAAEQMRQDEARRNRPIVPPLRY